jgi:hypothetical protein
LLLTVNRPDYVIEVLVINQTVDLVALAEFRTFSALVFLYAPREIVGHAYVERLRAVGQDVHGIAAAFAGIHRSFASLRMTAFKRLND